MMITNKQRLASACLNLEYSLQHSDASREQPEVKSEILAEESYSKPGIFLGSVRVFVDKKVVISIQMGGFSCKQEAEETVCNKVLLELVGMGIMGLYKQKAPLYDTTAAKAEVIQSLLSERDYQDAMEDKKDSHITSALNMGGILSAIKVNLDRAVDAWYSEQTPYPKTTDFLRKIGGLCIKAGQMYGMSKRSL